MGSFPAGISRSHHTPNHQQHHPPHHRQQYKLVLEERQQSPELHSNCSSTSPPAPAQVAPLASASAAQPRPGSMSYKSSSSSTNLAGSPASKVLPPASFHENEPFGVSLLHGKHTPSDSDDKLLPRRATNSKGNLLSPLLSTSATNGWQQQQQQQQQKDKDKEKRYNGSKHGQESSTSLASFTAASSLFSKRHDILLSALDFLSPTSASATNLPTATSAVLSQPPAAASTSSTSGEAKSYHHHQQQQQGHSPHSQSLSPMPIGAEPLAQLLITLKEQNKSLIREIEDLRIKLADAEGE